MIAVFVTFQFGNTFTDQLLEMVTGLYGVRPSVEFAQVAALVENRPA